MTMKNMKNNIRDWWRRDGAYVKVFGTLTVLACEGIVIGRIAERHYVREDLMAAMLTGHPYGYFTDAAGAKHAIEVTDRLMRE